MKVLSHEKKILYIFICVVFIFGCMQNAGEKLNKGIELFNNGETLKGKACIEEGLVNSALIKKLDVNHYSYSENVIYYRQKKNLEIVWPLELEIDINENYNIISYDPDTKKLGLSNGYDIKIYNSEGGLIKTCGPTPDEQRIKAFIIINEKIYYYKDKKIYSYDIASDAVILLTNDKFTDSFGKEIYNVKFYKTDNLLAVIPGIAGRYYLSILDLKNNSIVLQNLNLASSKLFFHDNEIYALNGDAGKYNLVKLSLPSKKLKNISEFKKLTDIEFFSSGLLYEDNDGFWIVVYEKTVNQKIPLHFELAGKCSGRPVIKYLNAYYIIDMDIFSEKINLINNKITKVF